MSRPHFRGVYVAPICLTVASILTAGEPRNPPTADAAGKVEALEQRVLNLEEQVRTLQKQIQV